jgi:hypothetical protein
MADNSFLSQQARGGDIAQSGFSFQEKIVLSRIPQWLCDDGFEQMSHESNEDIDAVFFVPGVGSVMEAVQVKNHALSQTAFRDAIERFQRIDTANPGLYRRLVLVSAGLGKATRPAINDLKRVRELFPLYPEGAHISENAFQQFIGRFRDEQEARFVYSKVFVEPNWNVQVSGESLFRDALVNHFPEFRQASIEAIGRIYTNVAGVVKDRRSQIITRNQLEEIIFDNATWFLRPVRVHTSYGPDSIPAEASLHLEWSSFFGGRERNLPSGTEVWNGQFTEQLQGVRSWILKCRSTRQIQLTGSRRISTNFALGTMFSAVEKFSLEMISSDKTFWRTDAHPENSTEYSLVPRLVEGNGEDLVVSVGILYDISTDVEGNLKNLDLDLAPRLHIYGEKPLTSSQEANFCTREIKRFITDALQYTSCQRIHLFFRGPDFLALFLGHRLNPLVQIQCYEWTVERRYMPTCRLHPFSVPSVP